MFLPPLPGQWEFAYTVLAGGCPEEFWRVRIGVRQRLSDVMDGWTTQGSWTEAGTLDGDGSGGMDCGLIEAPRIVLALSPGRSE
jgi:hypothetical protein